MQALKNKSGLAVLISYEHTLVQKKNYLRQRRLLHNQPNKKT